MNVNTIIAEPQTPVLIQQRATAHNVVANFPFKNNTAEVLFITSYPPRECGIATYSQDLIMAINNTYSQSFKLTICALENDDEKNTYATDEVKYILNTDYPKAFVTLAKFVNEQTDIKLVVIQHEFGFFKNSEVAFLKMLQLLTKPVIIVFHTVLPLPNANVLLSIKSIASYVQSVIVMTYTSAKILEFQYKIDPQKISVISHGTHLVPHLDKQFLKTKYGYTGKKILSTFGLLSSGKNIETTLQALPAIVANNPTVLFLIIGKTHPTVANNEGEKYREMLEQKVLELGLNAHVQFVNKFLPLPILLDYLQFTDVYLFTSKDPNQAVSGTFSYAMSCGCPIVSTKIPHACEVLKSDAGIIIDFENPTQLSNAVNKLLASTHLLHQISLNGLHRMAPTAWQNAAIAHAILFKNVAQIPVVLRYNIPPVNIDHVKKLTTQFGIIQFAKINNPDISTGYTIDDNARALVAMCQHFTLTKNEDDIVLINRYLQFIYFCQQPNGSFLNYVNEYKKFTTQNHADNLEDSNGRAVWAIGHLLSLSHILPTNMVSLANTILKKALPVLFKIHSTRAMAFTIKGLYYASKNEQTEQNHSLIKTLANRLVQMYRHEAEEDWRWFESYLTYGNSILPEAMLCAWIATNNEEYKNIAESSFTFLLGKIFYNNCINVITNKGWLQKGGNASKIMKGGEQPIDVAYTIIALEKFYNISKNKAYKQKIKIAFNWFLGSNNLQQIIYNPCTGGCYDGLEDEYVNLNQGAESTISYLLARLAVERVIHSNRLLNNNLFTNIQ